LAAKWQQGATVFIAIRRYMVWRYEKKQ